MPENKTCNPTDSRPDRAGFIADGRSWCGSSDTEVSIEICRGAERRAVVVDKADICQWAAERYVAGEIDSLEETLPFLITHGGEQISVYHGLEEAVGEFELFRRRGDTDVALWKREAFNAGGAPLMQLADAGVSR